MQNCGWCGITCSVAQGEFCKGAKCVNVRDFGFDLGPFGPIPYDIKKDLPRPAPVQ